MMPERKIVVRKTGSATAGPGGVANTGVIIGDIHLAGRRAVEWPHQIGVIPRRSASFQERGASTALRESLAGGGRSVLCQVLSGLGGVGKTQLAADFARSQLGTVDLVMWVSAKSSAAIVDAYAQAAADILGDDSTDPEHGAQAFLAWLQTSATTENPRRWLIVLDDVQDPADLSGWWPPDGPHGCTLITTRRRDDALTGHATTITVGVYTPNEALKYLSEALAARGREEPDEQLERLSRDLGYLPLALSQAVAYIIDADLSCHEYRELLADQTARLEDLEPDALPDDQPHAVHAAWSLSIERANQIRPIGMALPMLQLVSMLDSSGIPQDILTSQPVLERLTNGTSQPERSATARDAELALRALHRLSLIDHSRDTPHAAVRTHQLIQRAVRDRLSSNEFDQTARQAADALVAAWPDVEDNTVLSRALRNNADALAVNSRAALWHPDAHPLLFRHGYSLGRTGQWAPATSYWQTLQVAAAQHLGAQHDSTFRIRGRLAGWLVRTGNHATGIAAREELLADQLAALGAEDPRTAATLSALAEERGQAGDYKGAVAALDEFLAHQLRTLDPEDPAIAATHRRIAHWSQSRRGHALGVRALEEFLSEQLRTLDPCHPRIAATRGALAEARGGIQDYAGAVAVLEELLAEQLRSLDPGDPSIEATRRRIAHWHQGGGRRNHAKAIVASEELLVEQLRTLGTADPRITATRRHIAYQRLRVGDILGAVNDLEDLLDLQVRTLDQTDPDIATTRTALAEARGQSGDAQGAVGALKELLADQLHVLDPEDPRIAATRRQIAHWSQGWSEMGHSNEIAGVEKLLTEQSRTLGRGNRQVSATRRRLAALRMQAGDTVRAVTELEDLLTEELGSLDPQNTRVAATRRALAEARGRTGDHEGAIAALKDVLADLAPEDPRVMTTRRQIAHRLRNAGDHTGAVTAFEELLSDHLRTLPLEDPRTTATRCALAEARRHSGDHQGAIAELEEVLAVQLRTLDKQDPRIAATRRQIRHVHRQWRNFQQGSGA